MACELLRGPEVAARLDKPGQECMAHHVRRDRASDSGVPSQAAEGGTGPSRPLRRTVSALEERGERMAMREPSAEWVCGYSSAEASQLTGLICPREACVDRASLCKSNSAVSAGWANSSSTPTGAWRASTAASPT